MCDTECRRLYHPSLRISVCMPACRHTALSPFARWACAEVCVRMRVHTRVRGLLTNKGGSADTRGRPT